MKINPALERNRTNPCSYLLSSIRSDESHGCLLGLRHTDKLCRSESTIVSPCRGKADLCGKNRTSRTCTYDCKRHLRSFHRAYHRDTFRLPTASYKYTLYRTNLQSSVCPICINEVLSDNRDISFLTTPSYRAISDIEDNG